MTRAYTPAYRYIKEVFAMSKPRAVQIPEALFVQLCRYHLLDITDAETETAIQQGLEAKLDAVKRRELYGKAHAGDEDARREYLDLVGITDDFRW